MKEKASSNQVIKGGRVAVNLHGDENAVCVYSPPCAPSDPFDPFQKAVYYSSFDKKTFVGRSRELEEVNKKLQESETAPIYIHSVGGVGKTTLARYYCARYKDQFDYVFFVELANEKSDPRLDLMKHFDCWHDSGDLCSEFKQFIQNSKILKGKVLLVVDNVVAQPQLSVLEELDSSFKSLGWSILVTTRVYFKERLFESRTLKLRELDAEDCRELFCIHFCRDNELLGQDQLQALNKLFELINNNTLLITLLARVAYARDVLPSSLLEKISADGFCGVTACCRREDNSNENVLTVIERMFKFDEILGEEKRILVYFSVLPDRLIPKSVLETFFNPNSNNTDNAESSQVSSVEDLLISLEARGWLICLRGDSDEVQYKCHSLIQTAARESFCPCFAECKVLVENMAAFVDQRDYDSNYAQVLKYLDCVDSVLCYLDALLGSEDKKDLRLYRLRKGYVRILNQLNYSPERTYELAETLNSIVEELFPISRIRRLLMSRNKATENVVERLKISRLYTEAYINFVREKEKYRAAHDWRVEAYDLAEKYLNEDHLELLRAKRSLAISKRDMSDPAGSLALLESIDQKLEEIQGRECSGGCLYDMDFARFHLGVLGSIGMSYQAIATSLRLDGSNEANAFALKSYDVRKRAVDLAERFFNNAAHIKLSHYNNLSVICMEIYEFYKPNESSYIEIAENYTMLSLEIRKSIHGENSLKMALALNNLSWLYFMKGNFEGAYDKALKALNIRLNLLSGEYYKAFVRSYIRLALSCYSIFVQKKDNCKADEALCYVDKVESIGAHVFAGNETNHTYRAVLNDCNMIRKGVSEAREVFA